MEMTAAEFAELLWTTEVTILRHERTGERHMCATIAVVNRLREVLRQPAYAALLRENGCPLPWPEDAGEFVYHKLRVGDLCPVDGIPLGTHPRCLSCTQLAGPGHAIEELDDEGICASCREADARRLAMMGRNEG